MGVVMAVGGARAQAPPTRLEEVVVTATRTEVPLSQVGSSLTVITADELAAKGTDQAGEALRGLPGFTMTQTSRRGGLANAFVRGANSNGTLVLIDGIRVNEPGGTFSFSDLTTEAIERIEILRGPQSALYGANALGGVIQVFTKRGRGGPEATGSFEGGNHATFREVGTVSWGTDRAGIFLSASRLDTNGQFDNDDSRNTVLAGTGQVRLPWEGEANLTLRFTDAAIGVPGQVGFGALNPDQRASRDEFDGGLRYTQAVTRWWRATAFAQVYDRHRKDEDPVSKPPAPIERGGRVGRAFFFPFLSRSTQQRYLVDFQNDFSLVERAKVSDVFTAGFEYQRERVATDDGRRQTLDRSRDNYAYFAQNQVGLWERLFLTAGVRIEDNEAFGTKVNPKVSAAYLVPDWGTKLKGNFGTGIRAPDFTENFAASATFAGNPDLRPERSISFDLGVEQRLLRDRVGIEMNYFNNRFKDVIRFVNCSDLAPSPPASCASLQGPFAGTFVNIGESRAQGFEVAATWQIGWGFAVRGEYTYLDAELTRSERPEHPVFGTQQPLLRRPKHAGSASLDYGGERLHVNLTGLFVGPRADSDFAGLGLTRNPGYARLDLAASYRLPFTRKGLKAVEVFGRIQNLFDRRYEEVLGFPSPAFSILAGVRGTFGP
jgi:vitamin B12 transporter